MKKIFVKFIIITLFLTFNALSENIKKIEINGNKRISDQTIKVLGDIKDKIDFSDSKINELLKKLYDSNFVKDIKISVDNGILKININV